MIGHYQGIKTYLPALDGVRAIAILLVIFSHAGFEHIVPGGLGVIIFFVLSGYLITHQLLGEIEKSGTINLHNFLLRRVLRLMPALIFFIVLICPILFFMGSPITLLQVFSGLFYYANYYHVWFGYPAHSPFPILWSLGVEAHFYLLLPLALLIFKKDLKKSITWILALAIIALAWRVALFESCPKAGWMMCGLEGKERFFATDALFDTLLFGSMTALALRYSSQTIKLILINFKSCAAAIIILLLTLLIRDEMFRQTLRFTTQSGCIAVVIMNVLYGQNSALPTFLSHPLLTHIGKLSYSLYLFHYGALAIVNMLAEHEGIGLVNGTSMAAYITLTMLFSYTSYYVIERPMLRLRHQFGSHSASEKVS